MTERITSQMMSNTTVATIDADLAQLGKTQQQLSTGYQINQASDNPYGAALTLSLNGQISAFNSYTANINDGNAWLQTASGGLQSIQSVVQSIRELTVEGSNGTMSKGDLNDAAQEVLQFLSQVKQSADTQYDGNYIFSGTAVNTQPYNQSTAAGTDAFAGNTGSINRAIGPNTSMPINANLSGVLGQGVPGDGGLLTTIRNIYNDLTATGGGTQDDLGNQMNALDSNMSSLESLQAQVGASQVRMQLASTRISALQITDQTQLGNVEDTDMAKATVAFSTEQAGYQAALQSTANIVQTSLLNFLQG